MKRFVILIVLAVAGAAGLYATGRFPASWLPSGDVAPAEAAEAREPTPPAVTVSRAAMADFEETILVTGTLVPREEVLIAPEVEGLRIVDVVVEDGARVTRGQVLARLETATVEAQLAQNNANIARATAAIAQAESQIVQAQARVEEARNALTRAEPLRQSGYLAESTFDQREASAKTSDALLIAARDGLNLAKADKALAEAQRSELLWRQSRTEIKSPVDGIVSRRDARIGAVASGTAGPLFRIIAKGEVELDAEVPERQLSRLAPGQAATIAIAGLGEIAGRVRLVSPEIDRSTRLGRVRILLDDLENPRIGSFARGTVTVAKGRGLAAPSPAVLFRGEQKYVQVVIDERVAARGVRTGLTAGDLVEVTEGLSAGDQVIVKAGTFLRDGDRVRPVTPTTSISEAK